MQIRFTKSAARPANVGAERQVPKSPRLLASTGLVLLSLSGSVALAAEPVAKTPSDPDVAEISVWGRREGRIGAAVSASEGVVSYAGFASRPLLRPGELAEVIPGLASTQHSGSGKANQYFLRGFNLDHGTDFSISLDGAPLNLRTHAHGQGYLDINGLTPEFVEQIDYRKGPYFAESGDFSAAGSADFRTFAELPSGSLQGQVGQNDFYRAVGALGLETGFVGIDVTASQGPWRSPEDLRKVSVLARAGTGDWSFTALAYTARWNSTDQVPDRAVSAGQISRLGAIDPTDGGRTDRLVLVARRHPDSDSDFVLYIQRYSLNLWSNFTYFLEDPVRGDQFEQAERRWVVGGSGNQTWRLADDWSLRAGVEARVDRVGSIGLYQTQARRRLSTSRHDRVTVSSAALWTGATWSPGPVRATFGLRADLMQADLSAMRPEESGDARGALLSPKLTLAWRVSDQIELYADAGRGFHSNDARGAVKPSSPAIRSGDRAPMFAAADGAEVGARFEAQGLSASVSLWALRLQSELVYAGDSGETESTGETERAGAEFLASWTPVPALSLDLSAAATRARYRDAPAGQDRLPNALESVLTAGATYHFSELTTIQATMRRLGPAPLVEDNSARSAASTLVNIGLIHRTGPVVLTLDVLNLFDSKDSDITYFYTSRLSGEPAEGIGDLHRHPMEPRQVRMGLKAAF